MDGKENNKQSAEAGPAAAAFGSLFKSLFKGKSLRDGFTRIAYRCSKLQALMGGEENNTEPVAKRQKVDVVTVQKAFRMKSVPEEFIQLAFQRASPIWVEIGRFMSDNDLEILGQPPELEGIDLYIKAERDTAYIKKEFIPTSEKEDPIQVLDVDDENFWYAWGADKAGFKTRA